MRREQSLMLRVGKLLLNIVELYIPIAAFVLVFVMFLVNIFFRYALNNPLTWPFELIVCGFVWLALLAGTYVRRVDGHVKFTLTYDRMSPKMQTVVRIVVNALTAVFFSVAVPATLDWVRFVRIQATATLRIPFSVVYMVTIPFLVLIVGHSTWDIVVDIRQLLAMKAKTDPQANDESSEESL